MPDVSSPSATSAALAPQYEPDLVERRLYEWWEEQGAFIADNESPKPKYVIVLPPPNVTGVLHIGHALTCTLEDILIRRKRMQGFNVLWVPGTDHAGIATQMVVERNLKNETGKTRHDLGRDAFLKELWEWKEKSQETILGQLRLMGCSLDWSRLAFTMDPEISRAVRECFVRLHREGLIYRSQAMVHWDPVSHTALSDLEVKHQSVKGKLWTLRYESVERKGQFLCVATTRPETVFGDVAVAVHPDDERYSKWIGKAVRIPVCGREIPVIADSYVDPKFGTGALKITPAHDINDWEVGKRHNLPAIDCMDVSARMTSVAGEFVGLSREQARTKVIERATELMLLEGERDHLHNVAFSDRTNVPIEPKLSVQWYVKADVLAKDAIRAVEQGEIRIIPAEWEKTYFEWMRGIRPWCISRQLWWGHRIPVWYCDHCQLPTVAVDTPTACEHCKKTDLKQDEDVLDTWFSSGMWPFVTLGWPKDTQDMKAFYPNDVMETGFDILFFWVARMIMLGKKMTGEFPFHTVYLHPMVRDEYGQKMSKTKGNVKDPLEIIHRMGADSLRFTLSSLAVHGRDVSLSDSRMEGYRNFINKIWNASRFVLLHFGTLSQAKTNRKDSMNQWILSRLERAKAEVNLALDQYRFFDAAERLYHFVWSEYCDWYLELLKIDLEERKAANDGCAIEVLDEILRLLHPLIPFVTEEVWQKLPTERGTWSIQFAPYPTANAQNTFLETETRFERVRALIDGIRKKRSESNVSPAVKIDVLVVAPKAILKELEPFTAVVERLAKASSLKWTSEGNVEGKVRIPITTSAESFEVQIPREQIEPAGDSGSEKERFEKELAQVEGELDRGNAKLKNETFMSKAPESVVAGVRERMKVLEQRASTLRELLGK